MSPHPVPVLVHRFQFAAKVDRAARVGVHRGSSRRLLMRSAPLNFHTA